MASIGLSFLAVPIEFPLSPPSENKKSFPHLGQGSLCGAALGARDARAALEDRDEVVHFSPLTTRSSKKMKRGLAFF